MSLDVSDCVKVEGNRFYLTENIASGKDVKFKTMWKGKMWFFEANVASDNRALNLTCIGSMNDITKI